jgi:hypothetical protein
MAAPQRVRADAQGRRPFTERRQVGSRSIGVVVAGGQAASVVLVAVVGATVWLRRFRVSPSSSAGFVVLAVVIRLGGLVAFRFRDPVSPSPSSLGGHAGARAVVTLPSSV